MTDEPKDIVERLHDWLTNIYEPPADELIAESAKEIDRLRDGLRWIAETPMQWTKPQGVIYWANVSLALAKKAMDTLDPEEK